LDSFKVGITAWEFCIFLGLIHIYKKLSQTEIIYQHIATNLLQMQNKKHQDNKDLTAAEQQDGLLTTVHQSMKSVSLSPWVWMQEPPRRSSDLKKSSCLPGQDTVIL